ncbi:OLC1v1014484C1 [Oldenlandia corymbosa var. corymbosa]|uniref:OLC1v1014484C1 n=1 Tax=Oldenlandia corymbosa var. corymbosa TaxID=529605 RepID=A0AAV1E481_OLDCO|nr:OLC1v1014484C1 [Oldenlandia corymbosa var. corymbosa]
MDLADDEEIATDRISDLPDEIISQKLLLSKSLLSKSWRLQWTGVASFHIESQWWLDFVDFVAFVDRLMLFKRSTINEFRLKWEDTRPTPTIGIIWVPRWLALSPNLVVVDVGLFSQYENSYLARTMSIDLPDQLFTCKTLEILKLRGPFLVKVPSQEVEVCLPKLSVLELNSVHFKSRGGKSLRMLLRGCPVLKSFRFERKHRFPSIHWWISSASLKHLEIYLYNDEDDIMRIFAPHVNNHHCKLLIDTPALEKLILTDQLSAKISISGGSNLNEAELDIRCVDHLRDTDYRNSIVRLIQGLSHVKILRLSDKTKQILSSSTCQQL